MPFVEPMLASASSKTFPSGTWYAEEKLDGHRLIVSVGEEPSLFGTPVVRAWSRNGIERALPTHVRQACEQLPEGIYDGEILVPGERSYGTAAIENSEKLLYVVFDVLRDAGGADLFSVKLRHRRELLETIFAKLGEHRGIKLSTRVRVQSHEELETLANVVWERDGEGLVVKNDESPYVPGKRPRDWFKVKKLRSAVLTVIGFREGKLGPHSVLLLRDDEENETTVKWKTLADLAEIEKDPRRFLGRKLRIEFQERTPDGGYRHPRWDRWEDE